MHLAIASLGECVPVGCITYTQLPKVRRLAAANLDLIGLP